MSESQLKPMLQEYLRQTTHDDAADAAHFPTHVQHRPSMYTDENPSPPSTVRMRRSAVADLIPMMEGLFFGEEAEQEEAIDEEAMLAVFSGFSGFVRRGSSRHSHRRSALSGSDLSEARRWSNHSDDTK
jgi:hypothetical protein